MRTAGSSFASYGRSRNRSTRTPVNASVSLSATNCNIISVTVAVAVMLVSFFRTSLRRDKNADNPIQRAAWHLDIRGCGVHQHDFAAALVNAIFRVALQTRKGVHELNKFDALQRSGQAKLR